jgi:FixJ family two-component response regulator
MITLVDDDDGVREATANLLRSHGYEVQTFESGRTLLGWNGLNETSCIITDIMMPEIDGFELHRRLVCAGYRRPVIFLTALTDSLAEARMRECHVHCILTKPCSERSLLDGVRSALSSAPDAP